MDNKGLGIFGERIASKFLQKKGYKIVEMNFRKSWGEIDIVAIDKDTLVFVEVKTRIEFGRISPEDSITHWKINSLKKNALLYKNTHKNLPDLIRVDFIGIVLDKQLNVKQINHQKSIIK